MTTNKNVILLRGAQGSGKTTLGTFIINNLPKAILIEADQFFTKPDGTYEWDHSKVTEAHADCMHRFKDAIADVNIETIVVANVFAKHEHINPYIEVADVSDIPVRVVTLLTEHKNIHRVPDDVTSAARETLLKNKLQQEVYIRPGDKLRFGDVIYEAK